MDVLIITGGSRGIGAAVARQAAREFAVAVNYLHGEKQAEELVVEINLAGGKAIAIQGDVSCEKEVIRMFEEVTRQLGAVHALVNNAGVTGHLGTLEELARESLERIFAVNVFGTILCSREAVRRMSTRNGGTGGVIVNVSSRAGVLGGAGEWVHYAASKGAIDSFTVGLAREMADQGIRVNAVSPGLIDTELHASAGSPDRVARLAPAIPMKRAGTASEVAEGILWLLSPASSYVTGAILPVSGGR
jgi:NAD(P)-dependent dehydrogenase (short-subunit alcohol dehydrogenase family)